MTVVLSKANGFSGYGWAFLHQNVTYALSFVKKPEFEKKSPVKTGPETIERGFLPYLAAGADSAGAEVGAAADAGAEVGADSAGAGLGASAGALGASAGFS
jgi:hypothetical protein